jgi:hypothetical protein
MTEENLYAEFTQQRFSQVVEMPFTRPDGSKIALPMTILSGRELFEAKKAAERMTISFYDGKVPKKDEASSYNEMFEEQLCWQLIFHSIRQPNDLKKKFFPTFDAVLDMITPDQAGILKNCYLQVQLLQPWIIQLDNDDPEKVEAMIQKLMQDGTSNNFFLNSLTSVAQNILISSLASKLKKCMMDSGTLGTPPEDIKT